jgi:hypothetical protein
MIGVRRPNPNRIFAIAAITNTESEKGVIALRAREQGTGNREQ